MSRIQGLLLLLAVLVTYSYAVPTEKKQRSIEKGLSDLDHEEDGEHNADYDHDAFLGHEDKKTFDQLSPEESKERLAIIVGKIDKNKDGYVSEEELKEWIQYVQKRYIINDTERMWKDHLPDDDDNLSWVAYQKRTFGYEDDPNTKGSRTEAYADMINRDRRRWEKADRNGDGRLNKEEFMDFLHPEDADHMRDIVVMETIEDIDKDKDGQIDIEEYIADIWGDDDEEDEDDEEKSENGEPDWVASERDQFHQYRDKNHDGKLDTNEVKEWIIPEDYDHSSAEAKHLVAASDSDKIADMWPNRENADEEPEWVKSERKQFVNYRDKNKDGHLDKVEVKDWIMPEDFDHAKAESRHLVFETDSDKDGKLSEQEILDKYDLFVGSQATDFGEALTRHDEF